MAGNSASGRRPVPASIHLLRGNPSKKNFNDLLSGEVPWGDVATLPQCPDHLDEVARQRWDEVSGDLHSLGLLGRLDRDELAVYCQAFSDVVRYRARIREEEAKHKSGHVLITKNGFQQISAWKTLEKQAIEMMRSAGNSFGMNPAARSKPRASQPQGELFENKEQDVANKYF